MTYPFEWGAATDVGRAREKNEDAFVVKPEMGLFLALDGLGGHPAGDVAAAAAAKDLPDVVRERLDSMKARRSRTIRQWLARLIREQNGQLHLQGLTQSGCEGMGTTLAAVLLMAGRAYVANLGDSRVYRLRAGKLVRLSRDHSVVRELVEQGEIEPGDAMTHHARNLVTEYLGMPGEVHPYVRSYAVKREDCFLLCTDGLTDQVTEATVEELLRGRTDCQATCEQLVEMANASGGLDNVTAVLARWIDDPHERR
jgi:protein phosphatase